MGQSTKFLPTMKTALLALLLLVVVVAIEASPKKGGKGGRRGPPKCDIDNPDCPDDTTCYDEDDNGRVKCLLNCESDEVCEEISSRREHVCNDDGVCVRA